MNSISYKLKLVLLDKVLRNRIIFTLLALVFFRFLASIPISGIDKTALANFFNNNEFIGLLNIFSGGGLSSLSIIMLGIGPYITASIIMQLMTIMFPSLKRMYQEDGEAGRLKFSAWTRLLTVPLAIIQAFSFLKILESQSVLSSFSGFDILLNIIIVTAGSILLMWIGELITEYGIGNGSSIIIFAGIVASLPATVSRVLYSYNPADIPLYIVFAVVALIVIFAVVVITEAERPIPITYAKQVRGGKVYGGSSTYLPLRLNQAGVIPIIFASSLLLFPQIILRFVSNSSVEVLRTIADFLSGLLANNWFYSIAYFVLVFIFTYFYTAITFDPDNISENLQKNGAFIPGVRPGKPTSEHISKIITKLTLVGALFLGLIAVLPLVLRGLTGITAISVGGTALLIVVSVVIDLIKKIDSQVSIREY
jgi:preprotein translocase subunit SecY